MDFFLGQLIQVGFGYAPQGWQTAAGQILPLQQNTALFALFGTTFGGNGQTTFALPNAQSRVLVGTGQGPGLSPYAWGQIGGGEQVTLNIGNMPAHNHAATFTGTGSGSATAVQALTNVLPASLTGTPAADSFLANTAPSGPNQPKIYAPSGSGTPVNLGGVSGGGITGGTVQVAPTGGNGAFGIVQPYLAVFTLVCMNGIFPPRQ